MLRVAGFFFSCLALLCITAMSAGATTKIFTTAESDGGVGRHGDWWSEVDHHESVDTRGPFADTVYYPGQPRYYSMGWVVLQFPISNLRGLTLAPNSVKMHVYDSVHGYPLAPTVELLGFTLDGGGVITTSQTVGVRVADVPVSASAAWREVDITADLQRQINAGYNWAGYVFSMEKSYREGYYDTDVWIYTYEDADHRPYIEMPTVPEPSSLMALGGGLFGLLGFVRRRR